MQIPRYYMERNQIQSSRRRRKLVYVVKNGFFLLELRFLLALPYEFVRTYIIYITIFLLPLVCLLEFTFLSSYFHVPPYSTILYSCTFNQYFSCNTCHYATNKTLNIRFEESSDLCLMLPLLIQPHMALKYENWLDGKRRSFKARQKCFSS
jgi:hypothetical protein